MSPSPWIRKTFIAAGLTNIVGITAFSGGFTNDYFTSLDPVLFSASGCILIVIWGLAYLALSSSFDRAPWVSLVFAIEKFFYGASWVLWLAGPRPSLQEILDRNVLTGLFYGGYGVIDTGFGVFFLVVFLRYRTSDRNQP